MGTTPDITSNRNTEEQTMLITSMIVRALPEKVHALSRLLDKIPNVSTHGVHKQEYIIVVAETRDVPQLENLISYIANEFDDVLEVFTTYANWEEPGQPSGTPD